MKVFAVFVYVLALSRGMVLQNSMNVISPINMISLNVTGVDCDSMRISHLAFAYAPDPSSANALKKRGRIFDLNDDAVSKEYLPIAKETNSESSSLEKSSKSIAADLHIGGSFMAFSGSGTLKFGQDSSSQHQSMRRDTKLRASQCDLQAVDFFQTKPEKYLSPAFKDAIENFPAAKFAETFGAFYATGVQLGGQFSTTYIMEKSSKDTETTFSAEIEASYNVGVGNVEGSLGTSIKDRKNSKSGKIKRTVTWLGGDTSVLLSGPAVEKGEANPKWAATFNNNNLYPFKFELVPIWNLVSAVNAEKGQQVKEAYESTWSTEFNKLNRQINSFTPLSVDAVITDHEKTANAKDLAQTRKEACIVESDNAQAWIDTGVNPNKKRNRNWKAAAKACQDEMIDIKKALKDSTMTVTKFKDWINGVAVRRESEARRYWGLGGFDSDESNLVNRDTAKKIRDIKRLFD
jgi:hypothetical protein